MSYSHSGYHRIRTARILIEPTNAVPVYMETHTEPANEDQFTATWEFNPLFFHVSGGLAPRSLDWNEAATLSERQEFQVTGDIWLFKRGDAWLSPNRDDHQEHIQTI